MAERDLSRMAEVYDLLYGAVDRYRSVHCVATNWRAPRLDPQFVGPRAWWRTAKAVDHLGNHTPMPPTLPEDTLVTHEVWLRKQPVALRWEVSPAPPPSIFVRSGEAWWWRNDDEPVISSENERGVRMGRNQGLDDTLRDALDPSWLLAVLELTLTGTGSHGGRTALHLHGTRRATHHAVWPEYAAQPNRGPFLGQDADFYDLTIDRERGIVLAMTATDQDEIFASLTLDEIEFDADLPNSLFAPLTDARPPSERRRRAP